MEALLKVSGVVKEFPGVRALDGVDLEVEAGEVHCLLGQNGAGKSTLIKILSGAHDVDEGTITWDGQETPFSTPAKAIEHGVATIYQELDLVPHLDVTENVFLGHEVSRAGRISPWPSRSSSMRAAWFISPRLVKPSDDDSWPRKTFSATDRPSTRSSSW